MSFTGKEKAFVFGNLIKTTCGHVFNVNFGQNFQSSHQTDVPYRNDTRNLKGEMFVLGQGWPTCGALEG